MPYLSYTGFTKYETCPQAYYQEYILGQRPDIEDARNFFTGNALHKLLEDYIHNKDDDPQWIIDNAEPYWHEEVEVQPLIKWRNDDDADELLGKMIKWSKSLAGLVVEAKIKPEQWQTELKIDSPVNLFGTTVKMGGRVDLLRKKENGDVIFFDLKGSENRSIMKLDQIVWYSTVLGVYLDDMTQPRAGGYILPGFNEIKLYEVSDKNKMSLLRRVHKAFQGIKQQKWDAPIGGCKDFWCIVHGRGAQPTLENKNGIITLGG